MKELLMLQNKLTGEIPANYPKCTTLTRFRVNNNSLSGAVPAGLWGLSNVAIIDITSNQIEGPITSDIGNAKKLAQLFVSYNRLSGELPDEPDFRWQTSTSFSVGFSSKFSAQDSNSEPKPVEDDAGGGKRATVVTFNTPRESETEYDGDLSSSPQSEQVGSPVAWASPLKVESKRGICSRCGKGNRLKEREWCLVCDSKYCSNCLLKAM